MFPPCSHYVLVSFFHQLHVYKAGEEAKEEEEEEDEAELKGIVDIESRVSIQVLPVEDWCMLFDRTFVLLRDLFWHPKLSNIDLKSKYDVYRSAWCVRCIPHFRAQMQTDSLACALQAPHRIPCMQSQRVF